MRPEIGIRITEIGREPETGAREKAVPFLISAYRQEDEKTRTCIHDIPILTILAACWW